MTGRSVWLRLATFISCVLISCLGSSRPSVAQTVAQRGFVEARGAFFPQDTSNDSQNTVVDLLAREEAFVLPTSWIQFAAAIDARANSHGHVESSWHLDFRDRGRLRPALSVRRLSSTLTHGPMTLDLGKQFIRWGKTDIVTPTDRFAPRDFIDVFAGEFLAVTGVRLTLQARDETFEAVWVPLFTPSRMPLFNQRWTAVPPSETALSLIDGQAPFPERAQAGVRWAHAGNGYEYSLSYFDGFNHLPDIVVRPRADALELEIERSYPALRMLGGDAALPTRWFTAKGEAAYFATSTPGADEYVLYVLQLERQTGEWLIGGGYAGEVVTRRGTSVNFAPDRGLTRSVTGHASYAIDPSRSVAFECAIRQSGAGVYAKGEYSWTTGQHWRTTLFAVLLGGRADDFLGQYQRNSHLGLSLRYSF